MNGARLRIEMVVPTLEAGGMEVMVAALTRALTRRGHDVGVTCTQGWGVLADELAATGHRVTQLAAPGFRSNIRAPALEAWFRRRRPDVVHVHSGAWAKAARAARRAGVRRVVHTIHGLLDREPWYGAWLKRWAAGSTDCVAAVSEPLRDYVTAVAGVDASAVCVVPNGMDTARFAPGPRTGVIRDRLGIDADTFVVGNVARLAPVKNHLLLLEAMRPVCATGAPVRGVIVGDGPLRAALERRAHELGLASSVHFLGGAADPAPMYRDFDVFALTSDAEGTSMSLLEAMASGVCVVATAVGGTPDLLDAGRCGVLVPSGDPPALAGAITDLLRDPGRRRRLADAARARVVERYSEEMMVRAYEALYADDMQGRRPLASERCAG